jgi:plastocyanin
MFISYIRPIMKKSIGSLGRFSIGVAILFAILSISNSCTKDSSMYGMGNDNGGSGTPGANEVWIRGMAFDPAVITVAAGTTVTWTNKEAVAHTVTSNAGLFDSGDMGNGDVFSSAFDSTGTYLYHCTFHSNMKAKVIVN